MALSDITLIDTIGDLANLYRYAAIAFIGGSLVPERGHNPLEAARHGCPVLFGPSMEDFQEISSGLVKAGGGRQVADEHALYKEIEALVADDELRRAIGEQARRFSEGFQQVVADHLHLIDRYR